MNRNCKSSFDTIIGSATAYRSAVAAVLDSFSKKEQQARQDSAQYKDENTRYKTALESLTAEARAQLDKKRAEFTDAISNETEKLKKELHSLVLERPSVIYADMLRNYGDFGLKPTRTEIEALLEVNSGCLVGFSMLNSTLARVGSDFHIDGCDIATLEKDAKDLYGLSELAAHYASNEQHHALCQVYAGTPRLNGGRDTGDTWSSVSLITQRAMFESAVKSVDAMRERWSNLAPSITQLKDYKGAEDASAADLFLSDRKDASAHIEKNSSGVEQARNIGKTKAEANAKTAEVLNIYSK